MSGVARITDKMKNGAEANRIKGKSSVGDALRRGIAINDSSLLKLKNNSFDPQNVHHFRTTIRRLRSVLSSFKDAAPQARRKALNGRLKNLSQRYAELRQWDAFIATVTDNESAAHARTRQLLADAAKKRRRALIPRDQKLAQDIATVDRAIGDADWLQVPASGDAAAWNERIDRYAADLLDKQWRKLRKESRKLDLSDSPAFHKFRIDAKKHRYTIEVLAPLYRKKDVKPYLQRIVALQDLLGDMRDAMAAEEMIGQLDLPSAVRDAARKWLGRRAAECRKRFPAQGKAFRRETPFWE
ncbi:MAG: CHAD domain-containing protein [Stellaceae bacterium]